MSFASLYLCIATVNDKAVSVKCQKQKNTGKCGGCAKDFCITHMNEHHQELSEQLAQTQDQYHQFKNNTEERQSDFHRHPLIKQIDDGKTINPEDSASSR